jgi:hypothetical protein
MLYSGFLSMIEKEPPCGRLGSAEFQYKVGSGDPVLSRSD